MSVKILRNVIIIAHQLTSTYRVDKVTSIYRNYNILLIFQTQNISNETQSSYFVHYKQIRYIVSNSKYLKKLDFVYNSILLTLVFPSIRIYQSFCL